MENGFYGHLCLAENQSLLIDSSVRFGDIFGSQWMGEEMESKGAMDGPRYESKGAMQRFGYGFGLKIVVGRRSVGDGHGAWGRTSIWA